MKLFSQRLAATVIGLIASASSALAFAQTDKTIDTQLYKIRATTVVGGLKNPWGVAFCRMDA